MKKFVLIFFILLSSLASAESLYQYSVIGEIFNNNTVFYKLNLIFLNHPSQSIIIPLGSSYNIQFNENCKEESSLLGSNVVCSMEASNRTIITIQYFSNTVTKKDNYFLFSDSFKIPKDTDSISVVIKLPEGTGLKEPTESSYSPSNALIGSDGRRTIINWIKENLKANERFDVSIAFEKIGEERAYFPFEIVLVILLIIFSGLGLFYQFYWKGKNIKLILPVLKKDEKKIFDAIIKHGNGVNQKIIVKESGYSKAKVSKVLNSLKERGLIKLERIGRSNKIYIEKNFEKKA
ncbi:MAG: helix-turn-helix domain-containing protein [Candidatus Aenigmatarchaeota archaeon]